MIPHVEEGGDQSACVEVCPPVEEGGDEVERGWWKRGARAALGVSVVVLPSVEERGVCVLGEGR